MFYVFLLFVILFEGFISLFAPGFGITTSGSGLSEASANTTSELIAAGTNPLQTFIDIMTFQLEGGEGLSLIFIVLDIVLVVMVIRLIRGVD